MRPTLTWYVSTCVSSTLLLAMYVGTDASAAFVWITNEANAVVHRTTVRPVGIPGWNDFQFADFTAA